MKHPHAERLKIRVDHTWAENRGLAPNAIYFDFFLPKCLFWHSICAAEIVSHETAKLTRMDNAQVN